MAVFKDKNGQHYLGAIYLKSENYYSGNFLPISERNIRFALSFSKFFIRICLLSLVLSALGFVIKLFNNEAEIANYLLAFIGFVIALISVFYFIVGPVILSRKKTSLSRKEMVCLRPESTLLYVTTSLAAFALMIDTSFLIYPDFRLNDFVLLLFTLIPIMGVSGLAAYLYSKKIR
ncbi:hypothetical protein [Collimonas silvisoli]|uniref:hypothetical protein n=1 Tax=Collimonas silvisoli TaxID=2825884 RepID=UPI001B8D895D|nr:hypothetical protein [Collimonas silvisoli]